MSAPHPRPGIGKGAKCAHTAPLSACHSRGRASRFFAAYKSVEHNSLGQSRLRPDSTALRGPLGLDRDMRRHSIRLTKSLPARGFERLDWTGTSALLELYRQTSGTDRSEMIRAIGQVIHDHPGPETMIAQLINIASGLDLAQVEPEVRKLQNLPMATQEPLRGAIANYLAYRELTPPSSGKTASARRPVKTNVKAR
jgi:hypothetical protein